MQLRFRTAKRPSSQMMLSLVTGVLLAATHLAPQATPTAAPTPTFDVATIHAVDGGPNASRFLRMQGPHRFVAKNFTVRLLVAAAYDLNPKEITGGPGWLDTAHFDIEAITPGDTQPVRQQQMAMLRALLTERFQLRFHRESRTFAIYSLTVAKGGPKLSPSGKSANEPSNVTSTVYPDHVLMPARNASMGDFVAVLQRAILDRPVVDNTALPGRYNFDLSWAPSDREFGGELPTPPADTQSPSLVTALQEQLGLKLETTRGPADALIVDRVAQPSQN